MIPTTEKPKTDAEIRLELKKIIFRSWAAELLKVGMFDKRRYDSVVKKINSLKE